MNMTRTIIATLAVALFAASAHAGVLTIDNFVNGSDAATGISTAIPYTHLVDINKDSDTADINSVIFDNTLANYTLTGAGGNFSGNHANGANPGTGMRHLLDNFKYGGNPAVLTVKGLTPGETYKLRLYVSDWNGKTVTFTFDDTTVPTVVSGVDRGAGQSIPSSIDYVYTLGAGDTDLQVTVAPDEAGHTLHLYGFSNQIPAPAALPAGLMLLGLVALRRRSA